MKTSSKDRFNKLEAKAGFIRRQCLETACSAGRGHLGGAFSCVEILTALFYGGVLKFSPRELKNCNRDRFILSKGHSCLTLYSILADLGFFDKQRLQDYGKNGSLLGGHPDHHIPGIEVSTGSLGHGLGIGCGLALSAKLNRQSFLTVVLLGDGECCEGSVWEAATFASAQKLNNLVAIVDNNKVGATTETEKYAGPAPWPGKWKAFGWDVSEINGHNFKEIFSVLEIIRNRQSEKPLAIIANTVKGKGVSFMENDFHWHHGIPKDELLEQARKELNSFTKI